MDVWPAMQKATLLSYGMVRLSEGARLPFYPSAGSSGPMARGRSVYLEVLGRLVKLSLVKDPDCALLLSVEGGSWQLAGPQDVVLTEGPLRVRPVKARFHAPEMAFFHLGEGCALDCAFCTASAGRNRGWGRRTPEDWLRLAEDALEDAAGEAVDGGVSVMVGEKGTRAVGDAAGDAADGDAAEMVVKNGSKALEDPSGDAAERSRTISGHRRAAIAFTSGIDRGQNEDGAVSYMASVVSLVRGRFPRVAIGVEPYLSRRGGVRVLRDAGADELKLNVETATAGTFARLCPSLDRDGLLSALEEGVKVFGRGKVCSNILVGTGEDDGAVLEMVGRLASLGVVPTLRLLRVTDLNRGPLMEALGELPPPPDPHGLLHLNRETSAILEENGLSPDTFSTMCHRCGACDLVPGRDL